MKRLEAALAAVIIIGLVVLSMFIIGINAVLDPSAAVASNEWC